MLLTHNLIQNQLLNALSASEYEQLEPDLTLVPLKRGTILYEPREVIENVYFPQSGMISLISIMEDGATTEISLIGHQGMVGLPIILGSHYCISQAMVQISGTAFRLKSSTLKQAFQQGGNLQKILLLYIQAQLAQIAQYSACNRQHTILERLSRWLLLVQDGTRQAELPLTHEMIGTMLGCRRSGVTIAANTLQQAGIIQYHRGSITIINREQLEDTACECYQLIKDEFTRLLGSSKR